MTKFDENIESLRSYIDSVQDIVYYLPKFKRMLEIGELSKDVNAAFPGDTKPFDLDNSAINQGLERVVSSIGSLSKPQEGVIRDSYSMTLSGVTGSYVDIKSYEVNTAEEKLWKQNSITKFADYIDNWSIAESIKQKLSELGDSKLSQEFSEMLDYKDKFSSDFLDHSAFGSKTRNVLLHFKGLLKKAAQIELGERPSRDRNLSWGKMSKVLVTNPASSTQRSAFKECGDQWISAHKTLSGILKAYTIEDKDELLAVFNAVILIIDTILNLTDLNKLKNVTSRQ